MASSLQRVEDSPTYPVTVVDRLGTLGLLVTDPDGDAFVGTNDQPLDAGRRRVRRRQGRGGRRLDDAPASPT